MRLDDRASIRARENQVKESQTADPMYVSIGLQEWLDMKMRLQHLEADNRVLTQALQLIEVLIPGADPKEVARRALDSPAHKYLYG